MRSLALILLTSLTGFAFSHPADVSQLRIGVSREKLDLRFSLNVATIARIVRIDADGDNRVSYPEIENAIPQVRDFLAGSTLISINDEATNVGEFQRFECVWPNPQDSQLKPQDAGQRFVDFHFHRAWPSGVVTVRLDFKVFEQLGDLHTIQGVFHQAGESDTAVEFSQQAPDFLYATGWTAPAPRPQAARQWWGNALIIGALIALASCFGIVLKNRV
jgi:hypothetical protein